MITVQKEADDTKTEKRMGENRVCFNRLREERKERKKGRESCAVFVHHHLPTLSIQPKL
jgi:hypothetical protein